MPKPMDRDQWIGLIIGIPAGLIVVSCLKAPATKAMAVQLLGGVPLPWLFTAIFALLAVPFLVVVPTVVRISRQILRDGERLNLTSFFRFRDRHPEMLEEWRAAHFALLFLGWLILAAVFLFAAAQNRG